MNLLQKINFNFLITVAGFFLSLAPQKFAAQDTVVKRNNEKIIAKITEVYSTEIKYKLYSFPEGPLFILKKWELNSITYSNGQKELFDSIKAPLILPALFPKRDLSIISSGKYYFFQSTKITELDMLNIAKNPNDKPLNLIIKRTQNIRFTRKCFGMGGVLLGSFGLLTYVGFIPLKNQGNAFTQGTHHYNRAGRNANQAYQHTVGGYFLLAGLGCGITSVVIHLNEIKHAHLVVKLYNKIIN